MADAVEGRSAANTLPAARGLRSSLGLGLSLSGFVWYTDVTPGG